MNTAMHRHPEAQDVKPPKPQSTPVRPSLGALVARSLTAVAALLLATSTLACSALRAPLTPPEKGGPPWIELTSAHFVVKTDVDRYTARKIVGELERSHAALAYAIRRPVTLGQTPKPPAQPVGERETPVEVVVFERVADFRQVAPRNAGAFFSPHLQADFEPQPVIVMHDSELADETRLTVQHELAHRFLHERFGSMPRWLDEGLAQYHAPAHFRDGRLILGSATSTDFSERPFAWIASKDGFEQLEVPLHSAPTLRQLIEADRDEFYPAGGDSGPSRKQGERQSALYAGAWRLVHLLTNGPIPQYRARFAGFLDDLQRGARPRDAFLERFGDDWKGLDDAYRAYLTVDRLQLMVAQPPAAPATAAPVERQLSAADVHLLWARVMPWSKDKQSRVQEELGAASALAPLAPEVLLRRAMLALRAKDFAAALADLDVAMAKAPDEPRVLFAQVTCRDMQRRALPTGDARYKEIVERLARHAITAHQLDAVAWFRLAEGRVDDALGLSARALGADPLCWDCYDAHAVFLLQKGKLDEAMAASDRALGLAPERVSIDVLLEHRRKIEKARSESRPVR